MSTTQKWLLAIFIMFAGGAAVLAAVATSQVAVDTGAVSIPALGWLFPLIIEGGSIVALTLAWQRTMAGLSARAEYLALAALLLLTVAVNVHHAGQGPAWLGAVLPSVLAACPPVVLAGSVELLLRSLRAQRAVGTEQQKDGPDERTLQGDTSASTERSAERARTPESVSTERVSGAASTPVMSTEHPSDRVDTSARVAAAARPRPTRAVTTSVESKHASSSSKNETARKVEAILVENPAVTGSELAAILGVGRSTAQRYLTAARRMVA